MNFRRWVVFTFLIHVLVVLIPDYGAVGAAVASAVAYGTSAVYSLWVYRLQTGVPVGECLMLRRTDFRYLAEIVSAVIGKLKRWRS